MNYNQFWDEIKEKNACWFKKIRISDIEYLNVVWCFDDIDGASTAKCIWFDEWFNYIIIYFESTFFLDMSFTCHIIYKCTCSDNNFSRNVAIAL